MIILRNSLKNYLSLNMFWFAKIKKFNLPDLGEKIKQGTIKKWYVKQGDQVHEFQKIADIASDKQFTQLTAIDTGKISKIYHKQESICQVGELLLQIQLQGSQNIQVSQKKPVETQPIQQISQKAQTKTQTTQSTHHYIHSNSHPHIQATPAVRHLIKLHNLHAKDIKGTGKQGRILKQDVLNHIQKLNKRKTHEDVKFQEKKPVIQKKPTQLPSTGYKIVQMNNFEKGMQKTMTETNKIPTLYLHDQIDITRLAQARDRIKKYKNKSITFMSFFVKSFSLALRQYPILNSTYNNQKPFQYTTYQHHNITIAVDSPNGLAVPNIKNVENLSILQIQEQINRLRKSAEQAKISKKDLENGTICISNIGTVGGTYAGPLILPPQVAIVAIGKTLRLPRFQNDQSQKVVARKITPISFGCDHRVIDGGTVAKFINQWKLYLQNPQTMLINLK